MLFTRVGLRVAVAAAGVAATAVVIGAASGVSSAAASKAHAASSFRLAYIQWAGAADQEAMAAGVKAEAAKYGYQATIGNAQGNAANANSLMQTYATQHVNAIIVDSFSAANLATGIHAAEQAHIPVYNMYSPDAKPQPGIAYSIQANAGKQSAEAIIKDQGKKGSVLAFTLPSGANCGLSAKLFTQVMKQYPGWKVQTQAVPSPGWAQVAESTTRAWLLRHPKGTQLAIWGCWDAPNIGAAAALAASNRWDVKLYGQNTTAATVSLLEADHYQQSYYFTSRELATHTVDLIHSQAHTPYSKIKPKLASFPAISVTPQNVRQIVKKYPAIKSS